MDHHDDVDQALALLHAAGWSVGDTAFVTESGALVWLVSGRNGENVIRAEGPTQTAAWHMACDVAWGQRSANHHEDVVNPGGLRCHRTTPSRAGGRTLPCRVCPWRPWNPATGHTFAKRRPSFRETTAR